MLSGIGPADNCAEHGSPCWPTARASGANLQDHLEIYMQIACNSR